MFFLFKSPKTVEDFAKVCNSPWKISVWMWNRIYYVKDLRHLDYWQSAGVTLHRMKGDCDDFSILAKAGLEKLGYTPFLVAVYRYRKIGKGVRGRVGHLVCAYYDKKKRRYYHISNWGKHKSAKSVSGIAETVFKDAIRWRIQDEQKHILEEWVKVQNVWKCLSKVKKE